MSTPTPVSLGTMDLTATVSMEHTINHSASAPNADLPVVFQHTDFEGLSASVEKGSYTRAPGTVGDDAISSIKVPSGWKVTVFADNDFQGAQPRAHQRRRQPGRLQRQDLVAQGREI
jgi:hypothetical protein